MPEDTFRSLHAEGCLAGLPREEFAASAAGFFGRIDTIHAFREGNGRTRRAFFEVLARAAGHPLDFGVVSRERMTAASIAAHEQGDASMLTRLFVEILDPGRIDALRTARVALDRAGFDWRGRYMSTTEGGRSYGLTMAGRSGDHSMALDGTRGIVIGMASDLPAPILDRGRPFRLVTVPSKLWSRDGLPGDGEDRRPDDAGPAAPSIR